MPLPRELLSRYLSRGQLLLQRYRLDAMVGEGSYGAIYSAIDQFDGDVVAVKALPPNQEMASATAIGRFKREMAIIQSLVHPNVVTLFDYGETEHGVPFMVMEYIEGVTLDRCVRNQPMSYEDGLDVLCQIASALGAAHKLGIIHRDLKPANIMLRGGPGSYQVKMLDFGMAKLLSQLGEETIAAITREGMAVGTPRYIAPEQARGQAVGPYTDLYALGLLGYEIFTGERVVPHHDIEGAVMMHVSPKPLPLPRLGEIPTELRPILQRLMQKNPTMRYRVAEELLPELEALQRERRMVARGPIQRAASSQGSARHEPATFAQSQSLDLDYERLEQAQQVEQSARKIQASERELRHAGKAPVPSLQLDRAPGRPLKMFEWLLVPPVVLVAFTILSAAVGVESVVFRAALCSTPFILGALLGWLIQDRFPRLHMARVTWLAALIVFIAAHFLTDWATLKTNLMLAPAWYLEGVRDVPVLGQLHPVVQCFGRRYAEVLSLLS